MATFTLQLASAQRVQRIEGVLGFVGRDASGRFGLMPGHVPMSTVLSYGLARVKRVASSASVEGAGTGEQAEWWYLALPGGVLRFEANLLAIATRSFEMGQDVEAVSQALERAQEHDREQQQDLRQTLTQLEQTLMKRLWQLERA